MIQYVYLILGDLMRYSGKLIRWDDDKGFGFIEHEDIKNGVFIHIKSFNNPQNRPQVNDIITYELNKDINGKYNAKNASIRSALSKSTRQVKVARDTQDSGASYFSKTIAFVFFGYLILLSKSMPFVVPFYFMMGLITYFMYSSDKQKAQRDKWRTPESTLLFFGLIGGWMGAIFAHRQLRHKNRKMDFQAKFWMTVFLNIGGLIWFLRSNIDIMNILGSILTSRH